MFAHLTARMKAFVHPCLSCPCLIAQNTSVHGRDVSADLHEKAVLSSQFCDINQTDDIDSVTWRKHEKETFKVLLHVVHNYTMYYSSYQDRIKYHFNNQSLIFYEVQKKDEGVYEASLEYKNGTILPYNITLWVNSKYNICNNI